MARVWNALRGLKVAIAGEDDALADRLRERLSGLGLPPVASGPAGADGADVVIWAGPPGPGDADGPFVVAGAEEHEHCPSLVEPYDDAELAATLLVAAHAAADPYRAVVEEQTEFIVRWLPDGTRTFVNEAYARYFGQPRQALIGTSFFPLIASEEEREAVRARIARLTPDHPVMVNQHRARRADGEWRWQEWVDRAFFDDRGNLVEMQSVGRDVHDRVMTEQELRESRNLLQLLVENTPAAIAMFDTEMRYLGWSRRWLTDYGLGERDLTGLSHYEVFPEIGKDWKAVHRRCLAGATESREDDLFPRADGRVDHVRWVVQPWYRAENQVGGLIMFTEVLTERRRQEEILRRTEAERQQLQAQVIQAQKMEAVGRLAAGVAHDFNNLLTVINGYSEILLARGGFGASTRPLIGEIREAAARATLLTRQLLAFSRRQALQPRSVDLGELVAGVTRLLERLLGENIVLATLSSAGLWPVRVDPGQIEQVLVNLAINARDAMPQGGTLTVDVTNIDVEGEPPVAGMAPGRWVRLTVNDTGVGMDEETRRRAFEPFFTTKEADKGTGLGLSTVYGIVSQSGGYISLTSEPGRGTTFRLYFPPDDPNVAPGPGEEETAASARPSTDAARPGECVLLVEDDDGVRALAAAALRDRGYRVLEADGGEAALRVFAEHPGEVHVLVTDLGMPGLGGRAVAERLLAEQPSLRVLFLSGYPADATGGRLPRGGALLAKPFTLDALARRVRQALDG